MSCSARQAAYEAYNAKTFSPKIVKTRKEHTCHQCGTVIKAGSRVWAKTEEVQRWLSRSEHVKQHVTRYWCLACRKVEEV